MGEKKEFAPEVLKEFGIIKEGKNSNWVKMVYSVNYNGTEHIDIRNVKCNEDGTKMFSKGISMTIPEAHNATEILVESGYGDTEKLQEFLDNR